MPTLQPWVINAFGALVAFFFVGFLFKAVSKENPYLMSVVLYAVAAVAAGCVIVFGSQGLARPSLRSIVIAGLIGLASLTGTIFSLRSIATAPNPGYTIAIYSAFFVPVAIASYFVFGSSLGWQQFLGIVAVLIGLVLLSLPR